MNQPSTNVNTPQYWDEVYRREWESGKVESGHYIRDYRPIHEATIGLIPDGSRVLDIACGPGLLCRRIKQALPGTQVLGVDFSQFTIDQNQKLDAELGVEYACLDIRNSLGNLQRQFDVITMCEILEHLEQPEAMVADAFDLLKPGGRFILTCPHGDAIPDVEHVRDWNHDEVFHLLARYGNPVSFLQFPPPYYHIWMMAYLTKAQTSTP